VNNTKRKKMYQKTDERIERVVDRYATYKEDNIIKYLRSIGSNFAGNIGD